MICTHESNNVNPTALYIHIHIYICIGLYASRYQLLKLQIIFCVHNEKLAIKKSNSFLNIRNVLARVFRMLALHSNTKKTLCFIALYGMGICATEVSIVN